MVFSPGRRRTPSVNQAIIRTNANFAHGGDGGSICGGGRHRHRVIGGRAGRNAGPGWWTGTAGSDAGPDRPAGTGRSRRAAARARRSGHDSACASGHGNHHRVCDDGRFRWSRASRARHAGRRGAARRSIDADERRRTFHLRRVAGGPLHTAGVEGWIRGRAVRRETSRPPRNTDSTRGQTETRERQYCAAARVASSRAW